MRNRAVWFQKIVTFLAGLLAVVLITMINTQKVHADANEYKVKAAFLFNFAKFVEWPNEAFKDSQSPIVISIVGNDPIGEALNDFQGKTINGRQVVVHRARSMESLEKSHIIFISKSEKDKLQDVLRVTEKWNSLTVGDMKSFTQSGGMINLIKVDNKIGFEINSGSAERANLKMSSKLLKLAANVYSK